MVIKEGDILRKVQHKEHILDQAHEYDLHFNKIVFWSVVVIVITANFLASVVLVPFLAVLNRIFLDFLIVLLAFGIGYIYQFLIVDIKHLDRRHHLLAGLIVPTVAIVNVIIMVGVANGLITELSIENTRENPFTIAILYGVAFILPTLFYQFFRKKK